MSPHIGVVDQPPALLMTNSPETATSAMTPAMRTNRSLWFMQDSLSLVAGVCVAARVLPLGTVSAAHFCIELLFEQVGVCQQHSAAKVPLETEFVKCSLFELAVFQQPLVDLPLVANHLSTREAADWDDHGCRHPL